MNLGNIIGNISSDDLEEFLGRGACRGYMWEQCRGTEITILV
jgi:hypothetical protein